MPRVALCGLNLAPGRNGPHGLFEMLELIL
jgi:hypothetical protein